MRSKSIEILVRTLLFGVFLIIPSCVHADAVAFTGVNFSNLQINSSAGTLTFGVWQGTAFATAGQNLGSAGGFTEVTNTTTSNGDTAIATATVKFATSSAFAFAGMFLSSGIGALADPTDCHCLSSSSSRATLSNNFTVTGADGMVDVNISGLLTSTQTLVTNQFGVFAHSQVIVSIFVDSFDVFSMEFPSVTIGTNSMNLLQMSEQLAGAIAVQTNVEHSVTITIQANSTAQDDIPEPSTAVLLLSGVGFMAGLIKKQRHLSRR